MNKRILGICLLAVCTVSTMWAQGRKGLRINEVLINNATNYVDDYGQREAWIEIFNTTYGTVDISSCYLTDDKENPRKYPIPKGSKSTRIPPREHLLFWADNQPNRGIFHISFDLDSTKGNWIGLYDANGKDLIDSITVPATLPVDCSYARVDDGTTEWEIKDGTGNKYVTPGTNNVTLDSNEKIEKFEQYDPHGIGMAIMAMAIVFSGLLLLFLSFRLLGKISVWIKRRNAMRARGISDLEEAKEKGLGQVSGEVYAAIAMALYQHLEVHDVEDTVLTINKVKKAYSPWNSKIYSLREIPNKK